MNPDAAHFTSQVNDLTSDESTGMMYALASMRKLGRSIPLSMFAHYVPSTRAQERLRRLHSVVIKRAGVEGPVMNRR